MRYRELGKSGIEVSTVSMGCWGIGGGSTWGEQDEKKAIEAIKKAVNLGINSFDTAEAYGNGYSERILGKALDGQREEVVIASKVSSDNLAPEDLEKSLESSLERLNTEYIDIYYIHWPNPQIPISKTMETLKEMKEENKIRVIGCSNFGKKDLETLLKHGRVEVNQLPYNLLWRAIEYEVQDICIDNDIGIAAYSPLLHGLLTGKFSSPSEVPDGRARTRHFSKNRAQTRHSENGAEEKTFKTIQKIKNVAEEEGMSMAQLSIAWVAAQKGVSTVIAGARNPEQIKENAKAGELELSQKSQSKLRKISKELKEIFAKNVDMWESDEDSRIH